MTNRKDPPGVNVSVPKDRKYFGMRFHPRIGTQPRPDTLLLEEITEKIQKPKKGDLIRIVSKDGQVEWLRVDRARRWNGKRNGVQVEWPRITVHGHLYTPSELAVIEEEQDRKEKAEAAKARKRLQKKDDLDGWTSEDEADEDSFRERRAGSPDVDRPY